MWLPELLIVLALVIFAFGLRRAFQHPAAHGGSVKTALSIWFVLLVAGFLVWSWAAHRSNAVQGVFSVTVVSAHPRLW